jgi:uncharacterized membrane-anchored protein YitT (DUF2179 family)
MRERIANEGPDKNKHSSILPFNAMFIFLIFIIGISLLSLSVSIPMINAQTASAKMTGGAQMMGTCVVGVESPCNGTQWSK